MHAGALIAGMSAITVGTVGAVLLVGGEEALVADRVVDGDTLDVIRDGAERSV